MQTFYTGSWKQHTGQAYNCNRYREDVSGLSKKRASLERYLHVGYVFFNFKI